MYRFVFLLLAVSFAEGLPRDPLYKDFHGRVVGGSNAELGQFPYAAELKLVKHQCGGTILNNRWIVTAANCVYGKSASDFTINVGKVNLNEAGESYKIDKIVMHNEYDPRKKQNDIALIKVSSDIQFSTSVQPLPLADHETPDDSDVVFSGWGYTSWPSATETNDLKFVHLKTIQNTNCALRMIWFNTVTEYQICTFSRREGICGGDSGGPLVQDGKLVGIASWGVPCVSGYPDVYVNVYAYVEWITSHME